MILQELCRYYDRLAKDPDAAIEPYGFAPQKVAFEAVLKSDGSLHAIHDIRNRDGARPAPVIMSLPDCGKRTSNTKAQILWDKAEYLLGWTDDSAESARAAERHRACVKLHQLHQQGIDDSEYSVVVSFLERFKADSLTTEQLGLLSEIGSGFGVFRVQGKLGWVHSSPKVREYWAKQRLAEAASGKKGFCSVCGQHRPLARLHPAIKGVGGDVRNLVAVNTTEQPAFGSYGLKQAYNSPTGDDSAFKYATALNKLLEHNSGRRVQVGNATCVFWADAPSIGEDLFRFGLSGFQSEDTDVINALRPMLRSIKDGTAKAPNAEVGFCVMGLSPNKSRLSVRFWYRSTLGDMLEQVGRHQRELEIAHGPDDHDLIPAWLILDQTAMRKSDGKVDREKIPRLLSGALLRAILTGGRYPEALYAAILRRIQADRAVPHPRAAAIKAILTRNHGKEGLAMLDPERPEPAYQLGRMFAALEKAQEDALPGINATVKDRYFGAASATPGTVFPRLIRMNQHHIGKLEGGRKVHAEKRMQEICGRIDSFPAHLDLVGQGLFALGYYHQRQDFFTKKSGSDQEN